MKLWSLSRGERAELVQRHIAGALRGAGLEVEVRSIAPGGPGVIVFDAVSAELCQLLASASCGGDERIIAIASDREALGDGDSWRVIGAGASDVVTWSDSEQCIAHVAARFDRWREVDSLLESVVAREGLVGESPRWRSVLRQVVEAARFTDAPVLITGESGTGKELIARLIHLLNPRPKKPGLVVVDCTTIVPTLSGSEFFGHERGSFTGAVWAREGAFALADGGTLFLDEVGELPLPLQAELLRVVQEGAYKQVGSNTWRNTSFRLVCATNRELLSEAAEGRFRRDLYYRIAGSTFHLPPLRERPQDIPLFIKHFLSEMRPDGLCDLDDDVREFLLARSYPGNVRDLRHLVFRLSYRHVGPGPLTLGDVPEEERVVSPRQPTQDGGAFEEPVRRALARGATLKEIGRTAAETAVSIALAEEDGNASRAARRLGVTARALQLRRAADARTQLGAYRPEERDEGNGSPSSGN
jgi:transcriptional regulator with GAF, ATPase, and Fis domain